MAFMAYRTNKKTGVVYAYSVESYRDPTTKKPKSRRTYLGRVDPVTKLIVGKASDGKRNRSKLGTADATAAVTGTPGVIPVEVSTLLEQQQAQIKMLQDQLVQRDNRDKVFLEVLNDIRSALAKLPK